VEIQQVSWSKTDMTVKSSFVMVDLDQTWYYVGSLVQYNGKLGMSPLYTYNQPFPSNKTLKTHP